MEKNKFLSLFANILAEKRKSAYLKLLYKYKDVKEMQNYNYIRIFKHIRSKYSLNLL